MCELSTEGNAMLIIDDTTEPWTTDPERCRRAHVPAAFKFQTKPDIALALLDTACDLAVLHVCATADADYGDNPDFLNGLRVRGERDDVAVRADVTVAQAHRGPTERADAVLAGVPRGVWQTVAWAEGAKGTLRAKAVAARRWRAGWPHAARRLAQRAPDAPAVPPQRRRLAPAGCAPHARSRAATPLQPATTSRPMQC